MSGQLVWLRTLCIYGLGFSNLEAILQLQRREVYAFTIIKNKRNWSRHINGDAIRASAASLELGKCVAKCGLNLDHSQFHSLWLACVTATMWCFQCQLLVPSIQQVNLFHEVLHKASIVLSFLMITMYHGHSIDDNNNVQQGMRGIEEEWNTKTWLHRVFAFVMGVSEANAWLA